MIVATAVYWEVVPHSSWDRFGIHLYLASQRFWTICFPPAIVWIPLMFDRCDPTFGAIVGRWDRRCLEWLWLEMKVFILKKLVFRIFNYGLILPLKLLIGIQRAWLEFQKKPFSKFWILIFSDWRWSISRDDTCHAYQMEWLWQSCTFIWSSLRRCFNACAYFF